MNRPLPRLAIRPRPLAVAALMALGAATGAQAQSLTQLFEAARGFDATFLAARSQYEANLAQADYAVSAQDNSSPLDLASSGNMLMPIDAEAAISRPSTVIGLDNAAMIFSAIRCAEARPRRQLASRINSSPPSRASMSSGRSVMRMRVAISCSSASPH